MPVGALIGVGSKIPICQSGCDLRLEPGNPFEGRFRFRTLHNAQIVTRDGIVLSRNTDKKGPST